MQCLCLISKYYKQFIIWLHCYIYHKNTNTNKFGFTHSYCLAYKTVFCHIFKAHSKPIFSGTIWCVCTECDSETNFSNANIILEEYNNRVEYKVVSC